jgi:copper chaperone CopZ
MTHKNIIFLLLSSFSLFFVACGSENSKTEVIHVKASNLVKETVAVKGMTCVGCETRFEKAILKMDGVLKFKASSENNTATLEFDKSKTSLENVKKALADLNKNSCFKD